MTGQSTDVGSRPMRRRTWTGLIPGVCSLFPLLMAPVLGTFGSASAAVAWLVLLASVPFGGAVCVVAFAWSNPRAPRPWTLAPFAVTSVIFLGSTVALLTDVRGHSFDEFPSGRQAVELLSWLACIVATPVTAIVGGGVDARRHGPTS